MKPPFSRLSPAWSTCVTALFFLFTGVIAPVSAQSFFLDGDKATVKIESITPVSPASLKSGERMTLKIQYDNPVSDQVQIWARPYIGGQRATNFSAHSSATYGRGSGAVEGWFTFLSSSEIDEVRVEMIDSTTRKTLASTAMPVQAAWAGPASTNRPQIREMPPRAGPPTFIRTDPSKPLEIQFKAMDGRDVDLASLKGKVVLIDFWATWCGPCLAELPNVKALYDKYHLKGLEIIGISFDQDQESVAQLVQNKGIPWPQYFDGLGWKNKYGQQYGISALPTLWLIDKQGRLASNNARGNLVPLVEQLLAQ